MHVTMHRNDSGHRPDPTKQLMNVEKICIEGSSPQGRRLPTFHHYDILFVVS